MIKQSYIDSDYYEGEFIIKNISISKNLIKEIVDYLLSIGFKYNQEYLGHASSCWKNSILEAKKHKELELGKGNLDKAIEILLDIGGWINLDCRLSTVNTEVSIGFIPEKENVEVSFSINAIYVRQDEDVPDALDKLANKTFEHFSKKYECQIVDVSEAKKRYEEHYKKLQQKDE